MFSKTADPTSAPAPRPTMPGSATKSVLAADLKISGDITSTGTVEVMGEIDGTLSAKNLTIGAEGSVTGSVTADQVEVRGKLDGQITSESFTLRAAAHVTADIIYQTLVIESGATIEGRFNKPKR